MLHFHWVVVLTEEQRQKTPSVLYTHESPETVQEPLGGLGGHPTPSVLQVPTSGWSTPCHLPLSHR